MRPHIELYGSWMEERGLAASTIDRRLSTVCGFYRFAHIDGRIAANRRSTCVGPKSTPPTREASTAPNSATSCSQRSVATATTLRSPCSSVSSVSTAYG